MSHLRIIRVTESHPLPCGTAFGDNHGLCPLKSTKSLTAVIARLFTMAEMRYFDLDEKGEARAWIEAGLLAA